MSVLVLIAAGAAVLAAQGWEDVGTALFSGIPGYQPHADRLFTGVGSLVVIPRSGDVFVTVNREYGLFKSRDAGSTWHRVSEAPVGGRAYGGFSVNLDPATGRFAIFSIVSTVEPRSALTLDGGGTWSPVSRPEGVKHDGWTWGAVDWSASSPEVILGKQHHDYTAFWLSRDRGKTGRFGQPRRRALWPVKVATRVLR